MAAQATYAQTIARRIWRPSAMPEQSGEKSQERSILSLAALMLGNCEGYCTSIRLLRDFSSKPLKTLPAYSIVPPGFPRQQVLMERKRFLVRERATRKAQSQRTASIWPAAVVPDANIVFGFKWLAELYLASVGQRAVCAPRPSRFWPSSSLLMPPSWSTIPRRMCRPTPLDAATKSCQRLPSPTAVTEGKRRGALFALRRGFQIFVAALWTNLWMSRADCVNAFIM